MALATLVRRLPAWVAVALVLAVTPAAVAEPVTAGYRDFSFGASVSAPTGQKPQSKLWFNDGVWWGDLWNKGAGRWEIYRFDATLQGWTSTGTALDPRRTSQADILWDGSHLYVMSALKTGTTATDRRLLLFRYSYSGATRTYSLDAGFPSGVGSVAPEAVVFEKDSSGRLWVTYTDSNGSGGRSVFVAHSTTNDATWSAPYVLPVSGSSTLASDDISTAVTYGSSSSGRFIGVLYSNQADGTLNFAVHVDGAPDTAWTRSVIVGGPKIPDDHLNIKSLISDDSGRVFAVVKTSLSDKSPKDPNDPLIVLWTRSAAGTWSSSTVWKVGDDVTRAAVALDSEHRVAYVFGAAPCWSGGIVYMKSSPYDAPSFAAGVGTPFIQSSLDTHINNVTTTKQEVNSTTGILVEASDDHTRYYVHGWLSLSNSADTAPPDTTIDQGPSGTVSDSTASFSFSATEAGSTFECSLDGAAFATCTSPTSYSSLADGQHTFDVRATDAAANTDQTPATATWTVDTTPPDTTILTGPSGTVSDSTATFSLSSSENGATFACSLDGAAFATCTSPQSYSGLADGTHTFQVRAIDTAGNIDQSPATRTWTVSSAPPPAGITRQSTSTTANTTASTTLSVAKPAGTTSGDVLVACLALNGSQPTTTGVPAGWTRIAAVTSISNPHVFGYYHVAETSEPVSYQWTLSSSVPAGAGIARYSGVNTTTPLDANVSAVSGAAATTATLPGLTTVSPGAMLVGCMGANSSATTLTITGPAGLTEAWDIAGKRHEFDDGLRATAGATGNQTWTFSASREWAGWLTVLKPA